MNYFKIFAVAALSLLAAASCKKTEVVVEEESLSVSPSSLTFAAAGGNQTVTVSANCEWKAASEASWLQIIPANDGKSFAVVAASNEGSGEGTQARTAVVNVTGTTKKASVQVSQAGAEAQPVVSDVFSVSCDASALSLTAEGGSVKFTVEHSAAYTVALDGAWLSYTSVAGASSDEVTVKVEANTGDARTGKVTFNCESLQKSQSFDIAQAAGVVLNPYEITSVEQFQNMLSTAQTADDASKTYTLMNDIDFAGAAVTGYSGTFYATFDGNGKSLKNVNFTSDLFAKVQGVVKNLTIASGKFTVEPNHSCGIIAEQLLQGGKISGIKNYASVGGSVSIGTSTFHQGVIMGICRGECEGCENYGDVEIELSSTSKDLRFGGICGSFTPSTGTGETVMIKDCINKGNITIKCTTEKGILYLGGIAGLIDSKGATCTCTGNVNYGKLVAQNPGSYSKTIGIGGLFGIRNIGECSSCKNLGEVDGSAFDCETAYLGGLLGLQNAAADAAAFEGCESGGAVKGSKTIANSEGALNPLASTGLVVGYLKNVAATFGSAEKPIKVTGKLYVGTEAVALSAENLVAQCAGASNTGATINATL